MNCDAKYVLLLLLKNIGQFCID